MYSVPSHFMVAFFGGPAAIALFSFFSMRRIQKLTENVAFYIILFAFTIALILLEGYLHFAGWPEWLMISRSESSSEKVIMRIAALATFGVIYLFQKRYFTVSDMLNEKINTWPPGVACVLAGWIIQPAIILASGIIFGKI